MNWHTECLLIPRYSEAKWNKCQPSRSEKQKQKRTTQIYVSDSATKKMSKNKYHGDSVHDESFFNKLAIKYREKNRRLKNKRMQRKKNIQ